MPRISSAAKRQQGAANHRDTRHENGLVGPGKRVQKQKSNGHLNGHVKSSDSVPQHPPLPETPPPTNGNVRQPAPLADAIMESKVAMDHPRRPSVSGYSESSSSESFNNPPLIAVSNENHRRIDVNAAKNPDVHRDTNLLALALTIIRSCPLSDTIAILIVLLQLPPTFLTIIHLLFATLTFVPPSNYAPGGVTFQDIFNGTLGTPSVPVIVIVDLLVLLVWLFLWSPVQELALDLAQSVIALTLGGGTSGKEAGMKNILVCFSVIGASHFTRHNGAKQSGLRALITSSTGGLLGTPDPDDPLEPVPHTGNKKGAWLWLRCILGIHILAQGGVRYIRNWYVRRERRDTVASVGDPEAAKGPADASNDASNAQAQDDSSTSLPLSNAVITKKKKKHSAQVRIRQPLWAALASTKIVVVKEYETSHAAVESAGTNATDINNLGNAPFDTEAERIWITHIGSDSICFSTSFFPSYHPSDNLDSSCAGVDKSKPFYVRVNETTWQPTRTNTIESDHSVGDVTRWEGEIFGLAPMSSYTCEFISTVDKTVIFSTRVRTRQPQLDSATIGLVPNSQAGRPGSPTTTLKTSIATADAKLTEERSRQRRERKDQRAKLNSTRKELEKLTNAIATSGGNDDRLRQKVHQSNLHMKQAEEALVSLQAQLESLSSIPTDDASEYKASKAAYQSQKDQYKHSRNEFNAIKEANERDIQTLVNELASLQQKHERIQARIVKLQGEHERITDANAKGLDEAQRKAHEQERKTAERAQMEMMLHERLYTLNEEIENLVPNLQTLTAAVHSMQQAEAEIYAAQAGSPTVPNYGDIPEGAPANTTGYPWNLTPNTASLYAHPAYSSSAMQASSSQQGVYRRGRSSSMLSNISGFTQSSGEGVMQQGQGSSSRWAMEDKNLNFIDRKDSSGSGSVSGSGSGPGSVRDPKSPIGNGNGKKAAFGSGVWDEK